MKPPRIVHARKPKPRRPAKPAAPMKAAVVVEALSPQQIARRQRYENRWVKQLMESSDEPGG